MYDRMAFSLLLVSLNFIKPTHTHTGSPGLLVALLCIVLCKKTNLWLPLSAPGSHQLSLLLGSNSVRMDFPPQWLARSAFQTCCLCLQQILTKQHVLFPGEMLKRVVFELQKWEGKGRAKGTLPLSLCSWCCSLHPAYLRKLPLFSLPVYGP